MLAAWLNMIYDAEYVANPNAIVHHHPYFKYENNNREAMMRVGENHLKFYLKIISTLFKGNKPNTLINFGES